jgi:hypothetical protein
MLSDTIAIKENLSTLYFTVAGQDVNSISKSALKFD